MTKDKSRKPFNFKQFQVFHDKSTMKVGTDGVLIATWCSLEGASNALDVGTGCGVISLILAQRNTNLTMRAIDIDLDSVSEANENFSNSPWSSRLHASVDNFLDFKTEEKFDLIVSNPPFFEAGRSVEETPRLKARHAYALPFSGFISKCLPLMKKESKLALVLPVNEAKAFETIAFEHGLFLHRISHVYPKIDKPVERVLMELGKTEQRVVREKLVIQNEKRNDFTPEYIALTKAFYTIL